MAVKKQPSFFENFIKLFTSLTFLLIFVITSTLTFALIAPAISVAIHSIYCDWNQNITICGE